MLPTPPNRRVHCTTGVCSSCLAHEVLKPSGAARRWPACCAAPQHTYTCARLPCTTLVAAWKSQQLHMVVTSSPCHSWELEACAEPAAQSAADCNEMSWVNVGTQTGGHEMCQKLQGPLQCQCHWAGSLSLHCSGLHMQMQMAWRLSQRHDSKTHRVHVAISKEERCTRHKALGCQ